MKVICKYDNVHILNKNLHQFAFGQDEKGVVDLTIGREYDVYGIRDSRYGRFFLITTDEVNKDLPWWMPAPFFKVTNDTTPSTWVEVRYGFLNRSKEVASKFYFGHEIDIEDGTDAGYEAFKHMIQDIE